MNRESKCEIIDEISSNTKFYVAIRPDGEWPGSGPKKFISFGRDQISANTLARALSLSIHYSNTNSPSDGSVYHFEGNKIVYDKRSNYGVKLL